MIRDESRTDEWDGLGRRIPDLSSDDGGPTNLNPFTAYQYNGMTPPAVAVLGRIGAGRSHPSGDGHAGGER